MVKRRGILVGKGIYGINLETLKGDLQGYQARWLWSTSYRERFNYKSLLTAMPRSRGVRIERDDNAMSPAWRTVLPRRVHLLVRPQIR
jgi:hypothetical protein